MAAGAIPPLFFEQHRDVSTLAPGMAFSRTPKNTPVSIRRLNGRRSQPDFP
jgi:hypothetical protein